MSSNLLKESCEKKRVEILKSLKAKKVPALIAAKKLQALSKIISASEKDRLLDRATSQVFRAS